MLVLLALSVLLPAADPPIRVKLSDKAMARGDEGRVRVKTATGGYLVVLRADAQGRIRVLFPIEPGDSHAVPGGREVEIRGRNDRPAFTVDEREGSGKILAAYSAQPFRFDEFARAGHWDYRLLAAHDSASDPEAALLAIVQRMAVGSFDYDLATYTVGTRMPFRRSVGWGWGPWYDPWFFRPRWGFRTIFFW